MRLFCDYLYSFEEKCTLAVGTGSTVLQKHSPRLFNVGYVPVRVSALRLSWLVALIRHAAGNLFV